MLEIVSGVPIPLIIPNVKPMIKLHGGSKCERPKADPRIIPLTPSKANKLPIPIFIFAVIKYSFNYV
jgi:hypothetical protein